MKKNIIINFCPTGVKPTKNMTKYVPISPEEIAEQTYQVYKLGVSMVHIHARDKDGNNTNDKDIYGRIIQLIREKCPNIIIIVSLTGRIINTFEARSSVLDLKGSLKPDMGSLTLSSLNFSNSESINTPKMIKKLINKMNENNIKPELEVFDNGMINASKYYIKKGLLKPPFYYNIMIGNLYTAQDSLNDISSMINNLPFNSIFSLGGIGNCQKRVNYLSLLYADGVRVGLEDFIYEDENRIKLISNFDLVKRLTDFCNKNNINILNSKEVRNILNL